MVKVINTTETVVWSEKPFFYAGCRPMMWYNRVTTERSPYYCGSVRCNRKGCNEQWANKRMATVSNLIVKYDLCRFFTMSVDRSMTCEQAWDMIATWWKAFLRRLKYYLGKTDRKVKYFAVLEATEDGYPHIHGFWNVYVRQEYLSELWSRSAPGYVVDVRYVVDPKRSARYVAFKLGDYVSKEQSVVAGRSVKHRRRTVWRSQGLKTEFEVDKEAKEGYTDWELVKERYDGKTKRSREDMEGTCEPLLEEGTSGSFQTLDSAESERCYVQEARSVHRQEKQHKRRDQEAQRSWCFDT